MVAIKKTDKILDNINLSKQNDTYIYISQRSSANDSLMFWKHKREIKWSKYQIKESDMRVKTANFTSNQYLDLTTGQYCVLITSPYHEDFGGIIMSVEYDTKEGLYTYQCQDFSRSFQSKFDLIVSNATIHRVLQHLLTKGGVPVKGNAKKQIKKYKNNLSGLRPAWQYWERAWGGVLDYNPINIKRKIIIRNKSYIESIRDIVFGLGMYIDVYFDKYGVMHIEPYVKDEWLNTGLYLTTPEIANAKHKFDTTNVITGTVVYNADKTKIGNFYSSESLVNLDLSMFFGDLRASIENPNQSASTSTVTKTKTNNKNSKKISKTKTKNNNVYGTRKKRVYLNTDSITGYTSDMQRMKDMKKILKKNGWDVTITGVGAEAHWKKRGDVKKGIWFCLYGGACAGTLKEHCTSDWFLNPLKKNHSRVVVGFFPPTASILKGGKYYKHLPPAHDWQGNRAYANIDYPAKFMSKNGIPFMYAKNAKEMVSKFLAGGDNFKTDGNSYKYYGSWQKHKLKWL